MNLKRLRGIASCALITVAAALFAGCMNSMAGSTNGESRGAAVLHLSATGIPEEYAKEFEAYNKRVNGRSILPNDPFDIGSSAGQSAGLVLYLYGESETGLTYGPTKVKLGTAATVDGKASYDLVLDDNNDPIVMDTKSWALTLRAYKAGDDSADLENAVLIGYCSVDLRNGSGTANFEMGIAGLTAPGTVHIAGTALDVSALVNSYTMGIYRKDNLQDVGGTEKPGDPITLDADKKLSFTFDANNVKPGSYWFTMKFYNADKEIVGYFEDTIVINPGNALSLTGLVVDVIGSRPSEPKDLMAYFVDGSQSSDGSTYLVNVTWKESKYATNYELNVAESADDGATDLRPAAIDVAPADPYSDNSGRITIGNVYGMKSMDKSGTDFVEDFPGSDVFGTNSSSMMSGDTSCVLKLETGKVYEIQIRARNYMGVSHWVDRIEATAAGTGAMANDILYKAPANQHINLVRILYNLNGGELKLGTGGLAIRDRYAEYKCWTTDGDLLKIVAVNAAENDDYTLQLSGGGAQWAAWLLEDGVAVGVDPSDNAEKLLDADKTYTLDGDNISYRGISVTKYSYKNATVKASYGNTVTGAVTQQDKIVDINPRDIILTLNTDGSTDKLSNAAHSSTCTLPKVVNGQIQTYAIELSLNKVGDLSTPGNLYTNVKFEAWLNNTTTKTQLNTINDNACKLDTKDYGSGKLTVRITADTKAAKGLSWPVIFDVE